MALITCPECSGKVSDKAYSCPHCDFPMQGKSNGQKRHKYREYFDAALKACGITDKHTPQDCRHTCNSLLIEKKADRVIRYKIMGHAGKDINEKVYSHITVKQMREELEKI